MATISSYLDTSYLSKAFPRPPVQILFYFVFLNSIDGLLIKQLPLPVAWDLMFVQRLSNVYVNVSAPRYLYQFNAVGTVTITNVPPDKKRHLAASVDCVGW